MVILLHTGVVSSYAKATAWQETGCTTSKGMTWKRWHLGRWPCWPCTRSAYTRPLALPKRSSMREGGADACDVIMSSKGDFETRLW